MIKIDDTQISDLMTQNLEKTILTVKPTVIKPDAKPSEFGFNQIFDSNQDEQLLQTIEGISDLIVHGENGACFTMYQNHSTSQDDIYVNHPLT